MVVELEATDLCKERRNSRRCNPVPYSGATAMRTKFAYVGRGVLNLVVVLAVVLGLNTRIRGRVADTLGLIALSSVLVVSYVAGVPWIERRQASELIAADRKSVVRGMRV